jgi:hypothetical protein
LRVPLRGGNEIRPMVLDAPNQRSCSLGMVVIRKLVFDFLFERIYETSLENLLAG